MKILFIAMSESIHTARWINQITDMGWDIHLFPSIDYGATHPDLKNVTVHHSIYGVKKNDNRHITYRGYPVFSNTVAWCIRKLRGIFSPDYRVTQLKKVISKIKPDIIHSMEFQAAGYLTMETKKIYSDKFPIWIATNWGSDLYYFQRFPGHKEKIKEILEQCDYYSCECKRDVEMARVLGYTGKVLPVIPNAGGFDLEKLKNTGAPDIASNRRIVMVKGYQGWAGRALVALDAIERCASDLKNYEVIIFSGQSPEVKRKALEVCKKTGIPVTVLPQVSHREIMHFFEKARIYIGLSISDAISTSLLESMMSGAFPIQSDTSCASEWIKDGESGFIVPAEDANIVAEKVKIALHNDALVDNAARINAETARKRLDYHLIKEQVISEYEKIFTEAHSGT